MDHQEYAEFAPAGCQGLRVDLNTSHYPRSIAADVGMRSAHRDLALALIPHGFTAGTHDYFYAPGLTLDNARALDILRQVAKQLPWLPAALRSVSIVQIQDVIPEPLADLREAVAVA